MTLSELVDAAGPANGPGSAAGDRHPVDEN